jgi:anti-anti-sigma factor
MANNDIVPGFDDDKDDSLKIKIVEIDEAPNCLMLTLTGYIDTYNSSFFNKRMQKAMESGFSNLIFQCGGLNYVSSTGIGSFTTIMKTVKQKDGDVVLLDIQPKVYEVFQLLGFSQFFNIKDNLDDAVSFFNTEKPEENIVIFPNVVSCPICYKKLKAVKPGRFRCSDCKSILSIDEAGKVSLG